MQAVADPQLRRLNLSTKPSGCHEGIFVDTGHYWEVQTTDCGNASVLNYKGKEWMLEQFHWHSPSEHTIGGGYHDMECHMVRITKVLLASRLQRLNCVPGSACDDCITLSYQP
jgi:carbonic anhydrase